MSGITACLLGTVMSVGAPVPPEAKPDPTARGYMGITLGEGVTIERVEPNMPAAVAGLRDRDVIVRVNALHPQNYSEVIAHICSFRPGAVVEIEVRRGSERKAFKVKLAARPLDLDANRVLPGQPIIIDD